MGLPMSSNDVAIRVENLSMRFELYEAPRDQLKQLILPGLQRLTGQKPRKYFREFWALNEISFDVKKGESVGIIGRNGSGKSTLLQIITGTLTPTSGAVSTYGRIAALLELGSGFNPEFTGRENVYFNGALLGLDRAKIDRIFDSIAAFADIGLHLDQPVKTYSSGMLVRLAFAVQVQVEPDILIIDEALAVGDALFQKRCFQRIEKLVSNGTSLLFVSHDQETVRTLTKRALLLNSGKVSAWGQTSEVVLAYRRQLHAEDALHFGAAADDLTMRAHADSGSATEYKNAAVEFQSIESKSTTPLDFGRFAFGAGGVNIVQVETLNGQDERCAVFFPGDVLRIKIHCEAQISLEKLNVAIRIRNKEGVKIYSWGTLNQDIAILELRPESEVFWGKKIKAGEQFSVVFECMCGLGVNLYEIQASLSQEETLDYKSQRILHWVDEAAFFQVLMKNNEYFFGGVVDLKMKADW